MISVVDSSISVCLFRTVQAMAKRVPIFVDPVLQVSISEESIVACVERKSVGHCSRRRSSSLDTSIKSGKHKSRKSLAEKVHIDRKVCWQQFIELYVLIS